MVRVKICGLRTESAARACHEVGVDLVGLNFVAGRRRAIAPDVAARVAELAGPAERVGVFIAPTLELIERVHDIVRLDWIQLHGDETPAFCETVARRWKVLKALCVDERLRPSDVLAYADSATALLFDAPTIGEGHPFEWAKLGEIPRSCPWFLAGGLAPENVAQAIAIVRPDGVDTASGIETNGEPDPERIRTFSANARNAS